METLTGTLLSRVNRLLPAADAQPKWGSASLSTTPTALAVGEIAARVEALENAVREIAREVERLSAKHESRSSSI
jgi:uncharacterized protein YoxC